MAVIKTITTERGVVFPDQYCRVDQISATKTEMRFAVGIYLNQEAAQQGGPPHRAEDFGCAFDLFGDNPWVQAYAHLKQCWPDAIDA